MLSKEEYKERYYELSQRFFSLFDFLDDDVTEREIENIGFILFTFFNFLPLSSKMISAESAKIGRAHV